MLRPRAAAPRRTGRLPDVARPALQRPTVLVTGFDAFGGAAINPSWLVAQALHGRRIAGHRIAGARLPTVFDQSRAVLAGLLQLHRPKLVLCLGLAGGRAAISLERVAINVNDASIADNEGKQPVDSPVVRNGPAAYFTSLPVKAMLRAVQAAGLAAEVSQTAGTFVCNHVFYGLLHTLATQRGFKGVRGGFVHLPYLPDQGTPCMALDDMVRGLRIAIRCALKTEHDICHGAGAPH